MELNNKETIKAEINKACELPAGTVVNKFRIEDVLEEVKLSERHMESAIAMLTHLRIGQTTPEPKDVYKEWAQEIQSTISRFRDTIERII